MNSAIGGASPHRRGLAVAVDAVASLFRLAPSHGPRWPVATQAAISALSTRPLRSTVCSAYRSVRKVWPAIVQTCDSFISWCNRRNTMVSPVYARRSGVPGSP